MATLAEIDEGLPGQVRVFNSDWLDEDLSPAEEYVALAAGIGTDWLSITIDSSTKLAALIGHRSAS